ncbi:hypothetical protein LX36DRAFT_690758 [Colletotrichum falcatum]|nr:hypothetical protein LX36DRAFT_690758 [Colletotrichum falcatum]
MQQDAQESVRDLGPALSPSAEPSAPHASGKHRAATSSLTGDLIKQGTRRPGVVQLAMDHGASAVRGNNNQDPRPPAAIGRPPYEGSSAPSLADISSAVSSDRVTATQLSSLRLWPLRAGPWEGAVSPSWNAGSVMVVHGGLVPSLAPEEQDPWAVTNLRSLVLPSSETHPDAVQEALAKRRRDRWCRRTAFQVARDDKAGTESLNATASDGSGEDTGAQPSRTQRRRSHQGQRQKALDRYAWNEAQNSIGVPAQRTVVVCGRDARAGLQDRREVGVPEELEDKGTRGPWTRCAFGLDPGCAYGNALSAMVVEPSPEMDDVVHLIEQAG